jgi:hypothetical protein
VLLQQVTISSCPTGHSPTAFPSPCRYLTWYGVQGIFLDEGSNLCDDVPYYDALVAYIKTALSTAVTVLNWGTGKPCCLMLSGVYTLHRVLTSSNC